MDGMPPAREIARQCEHNPAYQWLTGAQAVCAGTLPDYPTAHSEALKDVAAQERLRRLESARLTPVPDPKP